MNDKTLKFELTANQLKFRDILNKEFLEMEIYAISDINPNRNETHFTLESMQNALPTCKNKPIVGFFENGDFTDHAGKVQFDPEMQKKFWDTEKGERVLGVIRESDPVEIVELNGLHWIRVRCALFVQYCYRQIKRLLRDKTKKVSVEITVHKSEIIDGVEEIYDFTLNGITILGTKYGKAVIEAIPGAHATILEQLDEDVLNQQKEVLSFAYKQFSCKLNDIESVRKEEITEMNNGAENSENISTYSIAFEKGAAFMSENDWNAIDKEEMAKYVAKAQNFSEIAHDIFLSLSDGWENGDVNALKYPIMEVQNGTAVYNRHGLAFAMAEAKENGEMEMVNKINEIYQSLGIESADEQCAACENNNAECSDCDSNGCDANENCGCDNENCSADGANDEEGKGDDNHDGDDHGDDHDDDNHDGDDDDHDDDDGDHGDEGHEGDDEGHKEGESVDNGEQCECDKMRAELCEANGKCEELSAKCEEYTAKIAELTEELSKYSDYSEIKSRMEVAEKKVFECFCNTMKTLAKEKLGCEEIADEDRERIEMKAACGEYADETALDQDVAYAAYKVRQGKPHNTKWERFNIDIHTQTSVESNVSTRQERLAKMANIKK